MEHANNETSQIPIKIENQTTTLNNGNETINNLEIKNVINNNIQQTNNIQGENTVAVSKDNGAKSSKCEEKCPFCFCKVKLLFCFNPCNKEDREKYKNEIPRTCCCILVVLLWIYLIYCMIIIFLCIYLPCAILECCGDAYEKEKKKKKKKIVLTLVSLNFLIIILMRREKLIILTTLEIKLNIIKKK